MQPNPKPSFLKFDTNIHVNLRMKKSQISKDITTKPSCFDDSDSDSDSDPIMRDKSQAKVASCMEI